MSSVILPRLKNDSGALAVRIGVKEFICIGETPPFDHPRIAIQMGKSQNVLCPYCATEFVFDDSLQAEKTVPSDCIYCDYEIKVQQKDEVVSEYSLYKEYKEMYEYELKRKNELTTALSMPMAIVTLLGSVLFYVVNNFSNPLNNLDWFAVPMVAISAGLLLVAIYFLIRSYSNYTYGYIPSAGALRNWKKGLEDHYATYGPRKTGSEVEMEVINRIYDGFASSADRNALLNDAKSGRLHKANRCLVWTIVFAIVAGVLSVSSSLSKTEKVYRVQVIGQGR